MSLVRTFVGTETSVAIDAVSAVLDRKSGYIRVILSDFLNKLPAKILPKRQNLLITSFVGIKLLLVIVAREVAQKINNLFHIFYPLFLISKVMSIYDLLPSI